jgi:hypothetical protein
MNTKVVKSFLSDHSEVFDVHVTIGAKTLVLCCEDERAANDLSRLLIGITEFYVQPS